MIQLLAILALVIFIYFDTRKLESLSKANEETYKNVRVQLWSAVIAIAGIGFFIGLLF